MLKPETEKLLTEGAVKVGQLGVAAVLSFVASRTASNLAGDLVHLVTRRSTRIELLPVNKVS